MKKAAVIIAGLAVIAFAGMVFLNRPDEQGPKTSSASNDTRAPEAESPAAEHTIIYTDSGFSPSSLRVKSGDRITIRNNSSGFVEFASDPHPVHTSNTELNAGGIGPGENGTFTAERRGTFGYHNHLNETQTGTLIVE
jgi:plastocyanin